MEGAIIGRCTFNDQTISLPIFCSTTFSAISTEICSRFSDLVSGTFELTYSLPGYPSCLLQTDMDIRMMHVSLSNDSNLFVDILVRKNEIAPATIETESPSILVEGRVNNDGDRFLGKFASPNTMVFLSHPWKTYIDHVNQTFEGGVKEFRTKLRKYAIEKGFQIRFIHNDKERVTAECMSKESEACDWRIHASLNRANGFFVIRKLNNEHKCINRRRDSNRSMMNSKVVADVLLEQLRSKPLIKPIDVVSDFKKNYGLDISYSSAWYGKEIAKSLLHGDDALSYHQLIWYKEMVEKTNPGSHCVLECDQDTKRFQRFFIAFNGSIEGFKFCRPLLFLDGTHVLNKYKGTLLAATGKNGNQGLFPLAFALVDAENLINWTWFLENLSKILTPQNRRITFVSDRCKGLLESVAHVFPDAAHGYCLEHLKKNIYAKYPGGFGTTFRSWIIKLFNDCAYAPTPELFEVNLKKLEDHGGQIIKKFLNNCPKQNWAEAFFEGSRYGEMWSNAAESYNSWITHERQLPIYQLVDGIRVKLMKMNSERYIAAKKWHTYLCPVMETLLDTYLDNMRSWDVIRSSEKTFEVHGDSSVMVDLQNWSCSCRQWEQKGFPCKHALAAIMKNGETPFDYIEDYFSAELYGSSYSFPIVPIPDIERPPLREDEDFLVMPPLTRKQPGRSKLKRIKSVGEEARPRKCSRCGQKTNHNRQTCSTPI